MYIDYVTDMSNWVVSTLCYFHSIFQWSTINFQLHSAVWSIERLLFWRNRGLRLSSVKNVTDGIKHTWLLRWPICLPSSESLKPRRILLTMYYHIKVSNIGVYFYVRIRTLTTNLARTDIGRLFTGEFARVRNSGPALCVNRVLYNIWRFKYLVHARWNN